MYPHLTRQKEPQKTIGVRVNRTGKHYRQFTATQPHLNRLCAKRRWRNQTDPASHQTQWKFQWACWKTDGSPVVPTAGIHSARL